MSARSSVVAVAIAGAAFASTAGAQRADSSTFADLREDGNGLAELRATITVGFDKRTAAAALAIIADRARLNLTFDPHLVELDTKVTILPRERRVAVALLEVARASRVLIRVSPRGHLVVVGASPAAVVSRRRPEWDTSSSRRAVDLPAMRTEAGRLERKAFATTASVGAIVMTGQALRTTPSFIEPDVLRSVQLLPGIEVRSDWTAGFNVRGGEADQSLVMIDGYPIYNPYHLGGLFSTFIDPMVGSIELRKGSMPARFGGRLSGVLDVTSAEPRSSDLAGTVDVSLASSSASLGRTFADGAGSWMVAGRRTYADAVYELMFPESFPYHFQDVQGHLTRAFDDGLRVSATGYVGLDALSSRTGERRRGGWGNSVAGTTIAKTIARSTALGGDSLIAEQRFSMTRFSAYIDYSASMFQTRNGVTDWRAAGSLTTHRRRTTHTVGYALSRQRLAYNGTSAYPTFGDIIPFDSLGQRNDVVSLVTDHVWRPDSSLVIQTGGRLDVVRPMNWSGISPRFSIKYLVSPTFAITAGGGAYSQWMHSLGREEEPLQPLQFWVGSDSGTPVSRARDAVLGVERWLSGNRLLHVEGFYKRFDDLLIPNPYNDSRQHGDEFTPTTGVSYGVDFLLRQLDGGPFSGWIAYTYGVSARTDPDGVRYFPIQDRRHNLNLVGSWKRGPYTFGARANLASGLVTTPAIGGYLRDRYDPAEARWFPTTDFASNQMIVGPRGSLRLPWYSRIDVSASRAGTAFGANVRPYASIVNLLNRHNPAAYTYSFEGRSQRATFPNLPFVPTFGVSIAY